MTGGFFFEHVVPLLILVAVWAYLKWIHKKADDPGVQLVGEVKGVEVDVVAAGARARGVAAHRGDVRQDLGPGEDRAPANTRSRCAPVRAPRRNDDSPSRE